MSDGGAVGRGSSMSCAAIAFGNPRAAPRSRALLTDDTFVVAQADGNPVRPRTLTRQWDMFLSRNKSLPRLRLPTISACPRKLVWLLSGVHPKIASEWLGHSKVSSQWTCISSVMPGMQEDAAARVDRDLDVINGRTKTIG